jgi:mutator protein MutT
MNSDFPVPNSAFRSDFQLVAVAVVEHQGAVLIGRRGPGQKLAGVWEFPGGKVLPGEDPAAAACRECREETGLAIGHLRLLRETEQRYAHATVRIQFFAAEPEDPLARPHEPFVWAPIPALADYAFPPANREVIAELLRRFSKS